MLSDSQTDVIYLRSPIFLSRLFALTKQLRLDHTDRFANRHRESAVMACLWHQNVGSIAINNKKSHKNLHMWDFFCNFAGSFVTRCGYGVVGVRVFRDYTNIMYI